MSRPVPFVPQPTEVCKYESPDKELNVYPYKNLNWLNYVERFKFKIPETIVTRADGHSICSNCKQLYVGHQDRCVRLRYGYKAGWHNNIHMGHKIVGESVSSYETVKESGLYPCNHYCTWDKAGAFSTQN